MVDKLGGLLEIGFGIQNGVFMGIEIEQNRHATLSPFRKFLSLFVTIKGAVLVLKKYHLQQSFLYGSSKIIASIAAKIKTFSAIDLATIDWSKWRQKRQEIEKLRTSLLQERHFRKNPDRYLIELET